MSKNMARHLRLKHPKVYRQMQKHLEPRNIPKGPRRSTSWLKGSWAKKYCQQVDIGRYQCNICETVLSLSPGLFGNMKRHIKSKHPYVYEKEVHSGDFSDGEVEFETELIEENTADSDQYLNEFIEEVKESMKARSEVTEKNYIDNEENSQSDPENGSFTPILNEDDPEFDTKVKYLVLKPVSGKKRARNCFWNFFNVIEENHLYSCLACNRRVAIFPNSLANMKRHIKMKHKKQYELITKYMAEAEIEEGKDSPLSFEKCYFNSIGDCEYKCKECECTITTTGNQELFDHIKDAHPDQILAYHEESLEQNVGEFSLVILNQED